MPNSEQLVGCWFIQYPLFILCMNQELATIEISLYMESGTDNLLREAASDYCLDDNTRNRKTLNFLTFFFPNTIFTKW